MQWKQRYQWKQYCSMTRRNIRHFPLASGRIEFVYKIIGNMAGSNKRWCKRLLEPSQETDVKKRICGNIYRNWFHYDLQLCMELQVLSKIAACLWFYAYKEYRNNKQTYSLTTSHPAARTLRRKWQFHLGNIWKITKSSNFQRHFLENAWSYRHAILHDNLEDQAQWHISKLYSFYWHFNVKVAVKCWVARRCCT